MQRDAARAARTTAAAALGALSAVHVLWAAGSAWPAADRDALADAIGGFAAVPGPRACLAVATLLAAAAMCVAGVPRSQPRLTRAGSALTVAALGLRGVAGLSGRMPHARRSAVFAGLDRRIYSPLCVGLALLSFPGVLPDQAAG